MPGEKRAWRWGCVGSGPWTVGSHHQWYPAANCHVCPQGFYFSVVWRKQICESVMVQFLSIPSSRPGVLGERRWARGSSGCTRARLCPSPGAAPAICHVRVPSAAETSGLSMFSGLLGSRAWWEAQPSRAEGAWAARGARLLGSDRLRGNELVPK